MADEVTNRLVNTFDCKQNAVRAVRFNVDGNYCLTCGSDKSVKLWNPITASLLKSYSGHGYEVLDAQASSDNSQICSGGMDKAVILTDVATGKVLRKYRSHAAQVNCVKFNEESTVILSGSLDGSIRTFDCKSKKMDPIQVMDEAGDSVTSVQVSIIVQVMDEARDSVTSVQVSIIVQVMDEARDSVTSVQVSDHEIMSGSADGCVRRYDIRNGQMISDFMGCAVSSVSFTRDGQCMLVSTMDSSIKLIDKDTGEMLNEYTGHKNTSYKVDNCLNHKDDQVIGGSEDGTVFVWSLVEARVLAKLHHQTARAVHSLSFHPSQACLLSAVENKVYVWRDKVDDAGDT